jgi:2',3'-cyclic-nucleotide 2'-phosphodiesterase (5'-nucleotidase family)
MKKLSYTLFLSIVGSLLLSSCGGSIFNNPGPEVIIVHTNDTHGSVDEKDHDAFGHERIATILKEKKEQYGNENVLFLDAGDTFHGTTFASLMKGDSISKLLSAMELDAMVPGNHDFNYGQKSLVNLTKARKISLLTSNVTFPGGKPLGELYTIKTIHGKKVGIFGLVTPETLTKTNPDNVRDLVFADPVETAKKIVKDLKFNKAEVIILLSHLGDEPTTPKEWRVSTIAEQVPGINLIIDGHTHTGLDEKQIINNTVIVRNQANGQSVGIVEIDYDKLKNGTDAITYTPILKEDAVGVEVFKPVTHMKKERYFEGEPYVVKKGDSLGKLSQTFNVPVNEIVNFNPHIIDGKTIRIGETYQIPIPKVREVEVTEMVPFRENEIKKDTLVSQVTTLLKDEGEKRLKTRVSYTPYTLDGAEGILDVSESNLGDYIADLAISKTGADIAILHSGDIKNSLNKGNVNVEDIVSIFPEGGVVTLKEVSGSQIKKILEDGVHNYPLPSSNFPQIGGMVITVDPTRETGNRIVSITLSNGKPFVLDEKYLLAQYKPMNSDDVNYEVSTDGKILGHYPGPGEMILSVISKQGIPKNYKSTDGRIKILGVQ